MKFFFLCPIPEEQKPIYEYLRLKENKNIQWTMFSFFNYQNKLLFFYQIFFLFFTISQLLFLNPKDFIDFVGWIENLLKILKNFFTNTPLNFSTITISEKINPSTLSIFSLFLQISRFSFFFLISFLFILFFFWEETNKNFQSSSVLYEEGSWYEVQTWEKPLFLIRNDRLLSTQRVQYIKRRLLVSLIQFCTITLLFFIF